jgi:serralysin
MLSFDTTQPSQVKGLNGYTVDPILTIGDKVGEYATPGILDGIGAYALNDTTVRVLVVSELRETVGYKYKLKNGLELPGARATFVDIDKRTLQITDAGLAYDTIINREGKEVKAATDLDFGGISRFCSAALIEAHQFGAGNGLTDRIFFSGEETLGGTQFALDINTNTLHAVPWFGRAGWENVTEINTGTTDKVAFIIGDDNNAPLTMYVGEKNARKDGSFLDRNGLAQGKLYAWVADDPTSATDAIETSAADFKGTNNSTKGKFVEIAYYDPSKRGTAVDGPDTDTTIQNDLGYDAQGFATYAQQNKLATDAKAFFFNRVEDVSTNPKDGTQVVAAITGVAGTANEFGTVIKIDVDFNNIATGDITGKVDILYDGNETDKKELGLRNPDNLDWADDGKIYVNEDRAFGGATASAVFGGPGKIEASLFSLDPAAADPSKTLTRIAQVDRAAIPAGQTDTAPTDVGNWETSGILDVSNLFGNKPGEVFLFDVQAHSLRGGSVISASNVDGNGDGTKTDAENLVEGGQLSFLIAPNAKIAQSGQLLVSGGTSGDNKLIAGETPGIDGIRNIIFAGAGKDEIDTAAAGARATGNRVDAGSGSDLIFIADADRSFGGAGDDEFEASEAKDYRASGGAGNDTFFLGTNGRALGGDGNDKFFAGSGGGNSLSGGAGVDQFWIANGEVPTAANTVLDFQIGTDVIGISGIGATAATLILTQVGADTSIGFGGQSLAVLKGIQAGSLTPSNASQFVFA